MTRLLKLSLFVLFCAFAIAQAPVKTVVLEGRVVSAAGAPVRRATIRLEMAPAIENMADLQDPQKMMAFLEKRKIFRAESDGEGKFAVQGLESGSFEMTVSRAGYVPHMDSVEIAEGGKGLTITLVPQAVISGKVLDEYGDPVPKAHVTILQREYSEAGWRFGEVQSAEATANGTYAIGELPAGRYSVSASSGESMEFNMGEIAGGTVSQGPRTAYVPTFYPGGTDIMRAAPIQLTAGAEARADIRMEKARVYQVRGKIAGDTGGARNMMLMLMRADGHTFWGGSMASSMAMVGKSGEFRFGSVAPGTYVLRLQVQNFGGPESVIEDEAAAAFEVRSAGGAVFTVGGDAPAAPGKTKEAPFVGQQAVVVGNQDVDGVILQVGKAGDIKGKWRIEGGPKGPEAEKKTANPTIYLSPTDPFGGQQPRAQAKADGSIEIKGVSPGDYRVNVMMPAKGAYVRSVRFGGEDVTGKTLTAGMGGGEMEIIFASDGGSVKCVVRDEAGQAPRDAFVAMWQQGEGKVPRGGFWGPGAAFEFDSMPPGEYLVAAFAIGAQDMQRGEWATAPEFLSQFTGQAVSVKVGAGSEQTVELKVIGKAAVEKALEKLP